MKYLNDISYKDCVGKVCKSLSSGDFKILKYNGSKDVEIQFLKTGYCKVAEMKEVKTGSIKDPYAPSVCGVGIVGIRYQTRVNDVPTKEYTLWKSMLERCYNNSFKKKYPTYEGCEVSDNFKSYEYFYEWCHKQIGFGGNGSGNPFHLDKDLLIKGNKVYSEDSCVFIPNDINLLLTKREALRGEHLIGVCWHNASKAFVAQVGKSKGRSEWLGCFNTEIEAFKAYKEAKELYIKEVANEWKSQIDPRAYEALMNYEVNIDD